MSSFKDYRLSSDTTPEAEDLLFELLAKKSPAEKLQMVSRACSMMRRLATSGLRERFTNDTDAQLKVRLAELLYGADIAQRVSERLLGARCKGTETNG